MADQPQLKRSKWLLVVFVVSVAANVLLLGSHFRDRILGKHRPNGPTGIHRNGTLPGIGGASAITSTADTWLFLADPGLS